MHDKNLNNPTTSDTKKTNKNAKTSKASHQAGFHDSIKRNNLITFKNMQK